jgi:ankyrin repeat protein
LKEVIYFIETGSSPNQKDAKMGKRGKSLLLIAMERGHYDIVKYLIEIGADVNANINTRFLGKYLFCKMKKKT